MRGLAAAVVAVAALLGPTRAPACGDRALYSYAGGVEDPNGSGALDPGELVGLSLRLVHDECALITVDVEGTVELLSPPPGVSLVRWPARVGVLSPLAHTRTDPSDLVLCIDRQVPCGTRVDLATATTGIWSAYYEAWYDGYHFPSRFVLYVGDRPGPEVAPGGTPWARAARRSDGYSLVHSTYDALLYQEVDASGMRVGAPVTLAYAGGPGPGVEVTSGDLGTGILWVSSYYYASSTRRLLFARIDPGGQLAAGPVMLRPAPAKTFPEAYPDLAEASDGYLVGFVEGGFVHLLPIDPLGSARAPERLHTPTFARAAVSPRLRLARSGSTVAAVWAEESASVHRLVFQRLTDLGDAAAPPALLVDVAAAPGERIELIDVEGGDSAFAVVYHRSRSDAPWSSETVFRAFAVDGSPLGPEVFLPAGWYERWDYPALSWGGGEWALFAVQHHDVARPVVYQRFRGSDGTPIGAPATLVPASFDGRPAQGFWDGEVAAVFHHDVGSVVAGYAGPAVVRFRRSDWPLFECRPGQVEGCADLVPREPPRAAIEASTTDACVGEWVHLEDVSTGSVVRREWDLDGDGDADATSRTAHLYSRGPKTLAVALRVFGLDATSQTSTVVRFGLEESPSVTGLRLTKDGADLVASWDPAPGTVGYRLLGSTSPDLAGSVPLSEGEPPLRLTPPDGLAYLGVEALSACR